jgi:hypothetical protein
MNAETKKHRATVSHVLFFRARQSRMSVAEAQGDGNISFQ